MPHPCLQPLISLMVSTALLLCSAAAHATYKCNDHGNVSYSELPCTNGQQQIVPATPATPDSRRADQQLLQQKADLQRLQKQRHQREAVEHTEQQRLARARVAQQKKCKTFAQRQKWAEEDARAAAGKKVESARHKARRAAEKYALECEK